MPPDELADVALTALRAALRMRPDVHLALLFGSRARGGAREGSDIDIAVLAPGIDILQLGADLARAAGSEVDMVRLEQVGVPLLEELIRDAVVIHEGVPGAGAEWRSRALAMLETDRPWYARMREAWLERLAQVGLLDGQP